LFLGQGRKDCEQLFKSHREEYEKLGTPSKLRGILRVHIEIPGVNGGDQVTYVKVDRDAYTEDLMVYINLTNLDSFFFEGVSENLEDVKKLKALIRLITSTQ